MLHPLPESLSHSFLGTWCEVLRGVGSWWLIGMQNIVWSVPASCPIERIRPEVEQEAS